MPDFLRLAGQKGEVLALDESRRALAPFVAARSGVAADEILPADDREPQPLSLKSFEIPVRYAAPAVALL